MTQSERFEILNLDLVPWVCAVYCHISWWITKWCSQTLFMFIYFFLESLIMFTLVNKTALWPRTQTVDKARCRHDSSWAVAGLLGTIRRIHGLATRAAAVLEVPLIKTQITLFKNNTIRITHEFVLLCDGWIVGLLPTCVNLGTTLVISSRSNKQITITNLLGVNTNHPDYFICLKGLNLEKKGSHVKCKKGALWQHFVKK